MTFKEKFFTQWFPLRRLFLWGNIILLSLLLIAIGKDNIRGWKHYQKDFKTKEIARAKQKLASAQTEEEKNIALQELHLAKNIKLEIRQLWIKDIGAVDRCITCHVGFDPLANSSMSTDYPEHPLKATAGTDAAAIHKLHDVEKFGCVMCHGGQGLATEVKAAHGEVSHWETPLLKGIHLQASCFKCHDNVDELIVNGKNYTNDIVNAKKLIRENGCLGCHQISGEGGPVSVDFKEETAAKPLSRIDFNYTGLPHHEHTLANWIKIHLTKDPITFVPGDPKGEFNTEPIAPSGMPPFLMKESDADAITAFILGLSKKGVPQTMRISRPKSTRPVYSSAVERGRWVYEEYGCAGCHANNARGGVRNYNSLNDGTPNLRRAVQTYTREELVDKISHGVPLVAKNDARGPTPPLYMPAWKEKIKGQDLDDLITYLISIKE